MHSGLQHYNSPAILRGVSVTFSVPCIEKYCVCSHDSCKPIPCCNLYLQHLPPFLFNFKKHCLHSVPGSLASVEIGWRAGSWFQDGNWTKTQDSGLRWRKQEGAEGLAAISTLVSAHKQEDQTAFGAGTMVIGAKWQQDFGKYYFLTFWQRDHLLGHTVQSVFLNEKRLTDNNFSISRF